MSVGLISSTESRPLCCLHPLWDRSIFICYIVSPISIHYICLVNLVTDSVNLMDVTHCYMFLSYILLPASIFFISAISFCTISKCSLKESQAFVTLFTSVPLLSISWTLVSSAASFLCISCMASTIMPMNRLRTVKLVTMINGTKNNHAQAYMFEQWTKYLGSPAFKSHDLKQGKC